MKPTLLFFSLAFVFTIACKQNKDTEHHHKETKHINGENHKHSHSANEHMHKRPVEELIAQFESPERDAYQQPEKVIEYLGDVDGKKVIDIGAGSGYFSVKLAANGAEVIAADVNDEFLTALDNRIAENNLKNIDL